MTQLDYARAMAFVAIEQTTGDLLGVGRLHANANYDTAEYAVLVRSDVKGRGIGWLLMQTILEYARSEGLQRVEGQVLNENTTMLTMCRKLGFAIAPIPMMQAAASSDSNSRQLPKRARTASVAERR